MKLEAELALRHLARLPSPLKQLPHSGQCMRKLFQIWLSLTIFSLVIYLPFYVFSNNALSAVEEVTPTDLIPFTGIRGQDHERVGLLLERAGVDTSKEL